MKKILLFKIVMVLFFITNKLQSQVTPIVIADGLVTPIGIEIDASGYIWVTEVGSGNDNGKVSLIDAMGNVETFLTGLPSKTDTSSGETVGVWRTFQLPDNKVMVVSGEGEHDLSGSLLILDKTGFPPTNPLGTGDIETQISISDFVFAQGFIESNPYSVAVDAVGNYFIVDAAANALLRKDVTTGDLSVFAEFPNFQNPLPFGPPFVDAVPTKVISKPSGGFYVCQLTGFPFLQGAANVYEVDEQGNTSVFADNLSLLTDMAIDPTDGNLTVLQFAEFDSMFNIALNSAKLIKLLPDGSRDTLAAGFGPSAGFAFDAAGDIYATHLFFGQVLKFNIPTAIEKVDRETVSLEVFPNPFSNSVNVLLKLEKDTEVVGEIFNIQGQLVRQIQNGDLPKGKHQLSWDGKTASGQFAHSGAYIYRLLIDGQPVSGTIYLMW